MPRTSRFGNRKIVHCDGGTSNCEDQAILAQVWGCPATLWLLRLRGWHLATRKSKAAFNEELLSDPGVRE
jgi:hypothetical protein